MDYPGKVIRKTPVTPSQTSASGVWTVDDAAAAVKNNNWPIAGVPNPISRSLRFNSADSAYLNWTPASAGNRRTWTLSFWLKRTTLGTATTETIFATNDDNLASGNFDNIRLTTTGGITDKLEFYSYSTGYSIRLITTQVFRDPSAWYHFVIAVDTTQATASNRVKIYLNGSQITAFTTETYPSQNYQTYINNAERQNLGVLRNVSSGLSQYLNGYITEFNFIDGQALTPSSFGMTDPQTGAWIPIKYTGTYGTNGFYVNFKDNSSTGTLGYDYSGNSNNWTANNFSVTAGAGNDSLTDVPTPWIAYNTTGDVGGVVRGNYCTLNPLQTAQSASAPNNGNLTSPANSGVWRRLGTTMQLPTTGKWYFEYNCDSFGTFNTFSIGVFSGNMPTTNDQIGFSATEWGYDAQTGQACARNNNSTITSGFSDATSGDVLQLAYDAATGSIWFGKNNTWQGASSPNPATGTSPTYTGVYNVTPVMVQNWATQSVNFGQRPFAYAPPAGFLSLCTTNLPTPTIGATSTTQAGDYFNTVLYTGNNSTLAVTGVGFQPDWVWIKQRSASATFSNAVIDAVRGRSKNLITNLTNAETTSTSTKDLTSFDSDGFSLGQSDNVTVNDNAATYVAWNWKANGAGSSNTSGTITSTVSANEAAGFSIVTYTGNATAGATIGHGLGATPSMIIVKDRVATSGAREWVVYHSSLGNTQAVFLSTTGAAYTGTNLWNNTSPTSAVFTVGNSSEGTNGSGNAMLAYCFAPIASYSSFGNYTGNGSLDGPFIYTGFRPKFVMIKNSSNGSAPWYVLDTARSPYNQAVLSLNPNSSAAEVTDTNFLDINSNGFKVRTDGSYVNGNTNTIIYAAFAEFPFKFSNAR